jgi:cytochrome P450
MIDAHRQHGTVLSLDMIAMNAVSVAGIDEQAKILQNSDQLGNLPLVRLSFGRVFPYIMAFLDGDDWKRIRRISQHALNIHKLSPLVDIAVDATYDMVRPAQQTFELSRMLKRFVFCFSCSLT